MVNGVREVPATSTCCSFTRLAVDQQLHPPALSECSEPLLQIFLRQIATTMWSEQQQTGQQEEQFPPTDLPSRIIVIAILHFAPFLSTPFELSYFLFFFCPTSMFQLF